MNTIVKITAGIFLLLAASCTPTTQPGSRPNILLIMADDLGFSDIGCYGGEIATPQLDRLAAEGIRYTRFYNTSRCCPTRASLLTGLYPHRAGIGQMTSDLGYDGYRGDLAMNAMTLAEVLKMAGYKSYLSGKWHVTGSMKPGGSKHNWPLQRGFDKFFGTLQGAGSFYDPVSLTRDNTPLDQPGEGFYYTDEISTHAVGFIRDHLKNTPNSPFFLYVPYTAPHWPLHAPEEEIEKYSDTYSVGWDTIRYMRHKRLVEMGIIDPSWKLSDRDESVPAWEEIADRDWQARRMAVYAAQVHVMDRGIGEIIAELKRTGQLDNTVVVFLSDNGGCNEELKETDWWLEDLAPDQTPDGRLVQKGNDREVMPGADTTFQSYGVPWSNVSNTPFRQYKKWAYEGGISSPLIIRWPVMISTRGALRHQLCHVIDIMPTLMEITGTEIPALFHGNSIIKPQGLSLLPSFSGDETLNRNIFFEHEGNRAVRSGDWKLVQWWGKNWELYHMPEDRTELHDLSNSLPEKVGELKALYRIWANENGVLEWPVDKLHE